MTVHTPDCTDCGCDEACTAPLPPDEGEALAEAMWEASHSAPWQYAAGWQRTQYRSHAAFLIANLAYRADPEHMAKMEKLGIADDWYEQSERLADRHEQGCPAEAHSDCRSVSCDCGRNDRRRAIGAALENEWQDGYGHGRRDEAENAAARAVALADEWSQDRNATHPIYSWSPAEFAAELRRTIGEAPE